MTAHIENTIEFELCADDETPIFVRDWPVTAKDNATKLNSDKVQGVVIMHGLGEHCGRYAHVARFFNALGFVVRTYDHRGHGKSGGNAGDVPDDAAMLRDAALVVNDFSRQLAEPPILLGHSMGGLFAARFAVAAIAPLRALILSSPALAIYMSDLQRGLLRFATAIFPGIGIPNGLKTRYLSHDAEVISAYKNDRLVHSKISARLLNSMLSAMDFSFQHAKDLKIPLLMLVALDDHLVDPEGSKRFFNLCNQEQDKQSRDFVTAHFYPDFYHEILNELDATQVFDDIRTWLEIQQFTPVLSESVAV
ncbi:alpha/beta hydrolase [Undibacterium sp. Dicai25W]|uniref:alpha/beta hydrolase n=1 Tax=Undibacterium sp. Dicai25W TaxID=3413034 RepID=UPI003BEFD7CC